jgi:hypothetical protein
MTDSRSRFERYGISGDALISNGVDNREPPTADPPSRSVTKTFIEVFGIGVVTWRCPGKLSARFAMLTPSLRLLFSRNVLRF